MEKCKCIYPRPDMDAKQEGMMFANIHIVFGYSQGSLDVFKSIAEELRETFPEAVDSEIGCGSITKSRFVKGFNIVRLNMEIPKDRTLYPGWDFRDSPPEYYWI